MFSYMYACIYQIYRQAWLDDWTEKGIDVVISPSVPVPAEILSGKKPTSGTHYVIICNNTRVIVRVSI